MSPTVGTMVQGVPFLAPGAFGHSNHALTTTKHRWFLKGFEQSLPVAILSARALNVPPAHKHELGLASWVWEATWAWRLDGRYLHRLRLSWWDVDDLHHVLAFCLNGEDLLACCRDLELTIEARGPAPYSMGGP